MVGKNRHQKIKELMDIATEKNLNKTTLFFLIATLTDKGLTKFHREMIEKNEQKVAEDK